MNTEVFDLGKIGITLGGEYDNNVIYEKLTIVLYKGKSYISTKTTQGVSPEEDILVWQLVAEAKDAYHMLIDAGKTTLTEEEFLEQLVDATKGRYILQGNITNAADEEDLTVEHSDLLGIDTLKLANRNNTNGMGYVILRKDKSFAEQITQENTIYEIRYEFDLNGQEITIPNGCVLEFQGGSFNNGTIVGNNTSIKSAPVKIFGLNISLSGDWNIEYSYAEWFGAIADGITDCYNAITKAIGFGPKNCHLLKGSYAVSNTIKLGYHHKLSGQQGPSTTICPTEGATMDTLILVGTSKDGSTATSNGHLRDLGIYKSPGDGVTCMYMTQGFNIENIEIKNCVEAGLRVTKVWYGAFRNIQSWYNKYGIVISILQDESNFSQINGIAFDNCWFASNTKISALIYATNAVSFNSCTFEKAGNTELYIKRLYHDISLYNCYMETTAQGIYISNHVESGSSFNIFGGYYVFRPKEDKYPIEILGIDIFNVSGSVLLLLDKSNLQKQYLIYSEAAVNYLVAAIRDNIKSIETTGKVIEPLQTYRYNDGIYYGCDARKWQTNTLRITHDGKAEKGSTANFFLGLNKASNIKYSEGIRGFIIDHTTTGNRLEDSVNFKIQLGTSTGEEGDFRDIFKVNYLGDINVSRRLKGNIAPNSGSSEERPPYSAMYKGLMYFDTTLNKPIFMVNNGVWVDATGVIV